MAYSVRHGTPGFAIAGVEVQYGIFPRRRNITLMVLLTVLLLLGLSFWSMMVRAYVSASQYETDRAPVTTARPAAPPVPATAPAVVNAPLDRSAALQTSLDGWLQTHTDHQWAVVVQGLGDDKSSATSNPNAASNMASIYKLLLMDALLQKTPRTAWDTTMITVQDKPRSLTDCVEAALLRSDNPCGEALGYYVGWGTANKILAGTGLTNTHLNIDTDGSPQDIALYLRKLYNGDLMDADDTSYIMSLMNRQVFRAGIPAGCGSACTVYDKTGDTGTVRNDAAIIELADGRAYTLVIMSNGATYGQIADLAKTLQGVMVAP